jgi:Uma2 family endonuclease
MTQAIVNPLAQPMAAKASAKPEVIWEKLPADFILPDDPVESIAQPLLAAALTESLDIAGLITPEMLIASNMAIAVKVNQKTNVKAPDWFYVTKAMRLSGGLIRRSYTPHAEGEVPAIVMEFLSEEETGEYSMRPIFPYGKMYFYEQILQVPLYLIFDPEDGRFEIRKLDSSGKYEIQPLDQNGRYLIESLGLHLGVWHGTRLDQTFHWLRWWDISGNLLLWGSEKLEQERLLLETEKQKAEAERQRAEAEKQRADLAEQEILRLRQLLANQEPSN